jgi:glycosyltransferase involved in cell wall biosynthesis
VGNLFSPLPYFLARYRSADMQHAIERHLSTADVDVVVCDFLHPAVNLPNRVAVPSILFQHNVEAMIWRRHFEVERHPAKRLYFRDQWRKARNAEAALCRRFDGVVAVSPEDRDMLAADYGLDTVHDVPTGVDTTYFQPDLAAPADANGIVFTGSLDWLPNLDAMRFFIEDIAPLLRRKVPNFHFRIVGRNPGAELASLAASQPGFELTGRVPDVRPYIRDAAVYVVPIRVGSGTRLKIFEAMAMQRPVVSTTVGCEGLPVRHGQHLLIADSPADFADAVATLMSDRELAASLARNAADMVRREFDWSGVADRFMAICESTVARAL